MSEEVMIYKTEIADVLLADLESRTDHRGSFTEIFRKSWFDIPEPIQWNMVSSKPNTFRGFHVHKKHHDYLTISAGSAIFYLKDLRKNSPTFLVEEAHQITAQTMRMLLIPPGVAHGFYFPENCIHVYGVTLYWNPKDELGFNYREPTLSFNLKHEKLNISDRDLQLGNLDDVLNQL